MHRFISEICLFSKNMYMDRSMYLNFSDIQKRNEWYQTCRNVFVLRDAVCAGVARYMFRVVDSHLLGYWLHSQHFRFLTGLCLEELCEKRAALVLPQAPAVSESDGHDSSRFIVLLSLVSYRQLVLNNHYIIRVRIVRYIFSVMNMCTVHSKHCSQHIYITSRKSQQSHFWGCQVQL